MRIFNGVVSSSLFQTSDGFSKLSDIESPAHDEDESQNNIVVTSELRSNTDPIE
jgi:hypothetical protein